MPPLHPALPPLPQDVDEALKRLPQEVVDARNQRLKRASDLSMKHSELPKELQQLQTPFDFYMKDTLDVSRPPLASVCMPRERAARCARGQPIGVQRSPRTPLYVGVAFLDLGCARLCLMPVHPASPAEQRCRNGGTPKCHPVSGAAACQACASRRGRRPHPRSWSSWRPRSAWRWVPASRTSATSLEKRAACPLAAPARRWTSRRQPGGAVAHPAQLSASGQPSVAARTACWASRSLMADRLALGCWPPPSAPSAPASCFTLPVGRLPPPAIPAACPFAAPLPSQH